MFYLLFLLFAGISLALCDDNDRLFLIIFTISSLYYCFFGYWYWAEIRKFEFMLVYWSDLLPRSRDIVLFYSAIVLASSAIFSRILDAPKPVGDIAFPTKPFFAMLCFGIGGSLYVLISAMAHGGLNDADSLVLLCGQFSDLLIPCILFYVAWRGWLVHSIICILLFVVFSVFVGFRTKIILLCAPVMYLVWIEGRTSLKKRATVIITTILVVMLFSIMTFSREKFNFLDLEKITSSGAIELLDGFFGESNILIGLIGVLTEFVDRDIYIWATPIVDSFIEFVPRFLYSDKSTGEYLIVAVRGLIASNSVESGTAYPFVGEYLIMGGYLMALFCSVFLGFFVVYLNRRVISSSISPHTCFAGLSLLATFFGYYYYSRGYIPQMIKLFVFIVAPYLYLIKASSIRVDHDHHN